MEEGQVIPVKVIFFHTAPENKFRVMEIKQNTMFLSQRVQVYWVCPSIQFLDILYMDLTESVSF